jgi:competence protein ComEA
MNWKKFSTDYLAFTRKERLGLLIIVVLVVGIWIFPKIAIPRRAETAVLDTSWMSVAKQLMKNETENEPVTDKKNTSAAVYDRADDLSPKSNGDLFYFDPNTLTVEGWKKLGIKEKTAITIQKYLSKGGHFEEPVDLKKIYGIAAEEYQRLAPYIRIQGREEQVRELQKLNAKQPSNQRSYSIIEINSADTSAFISLPGIGSKLASRIVNFRDKLGGFYSIDQIAETYGLPDSTFQRIKPFLRLENGSVYHLNINTATKDELKSHPYLKWNLANAIVEYRTQHGSFSSLDELKRISLITEEVFDKIKFYLVL